MVDEVWDKIGDAGMEMSENQDQDRMFELLRGAYTAVRKLHVKYEASIGYAWHPTRNAGTPSSDPSDQPKGGGPDGGRRNGRGGRQALNTEATANDADDADADEDAGPTNEVNATVLRQLANDDAACFAVVYERQNTYLSAQESAVAVRSPGLML